MQLHIVVFNDHTLHFQDNAHLLKYYPVKVYQNCFYSFNCSNQAGMQVSKYSFAHISMMDEVQNLIFITSYYIYSGLLIFLNK